MPTVLRIDGYRYFFYSREGSEPPHVHVERAEDRAKVWLHPVALAWTRGFRSDEIRELLGLTEKHQRFLLERWYEFFRN